MLHLLLRALAVLAVAAVAAVTGRDTELLRLALAGDRRARRDLVERLLPVIRARVRRVAMRRGAGLLGADEIDDLGQEVWAALVGDDARLLRAWEPERGATLGGYVGMIAEREAGNHVQRARALKRGGDRERVSDEGAIDRIAGHDDPEARAAAADLAGKLAAHLEATLTETGRLVMRYLYTDQRPPAEVAEILGMKPNAVYIWQHRIRAAAKDFLAEAV